MDSITSRMGKAPAEIALSERGSCTARFEDSRKLLEANSSVALPCATCWATVYQILRGIYDVHVLLQGHTQQYQKQNFIGFGPAQNVCYKSDLKKSACNFWETRPGIISRFLYAP